ncbi:MAG TPA: type VI secretion system-associated FHA domain protein, partial [Polyangiaceae bacterium]|nr:type VI secretion system-associated FHA domain protein [Polyangiaceae bacterium]
NTFDIVSISIRVRAVSLSLIPEPMSTRKPLAVTGLLQAPSQELAAMLASGLRPNDAEETNRLRSLHQKYRKAWAEFHSEVQAAAQRRPEAERGAFVSSLSAQYPGIGAEVEFQALAADAGAPSLTMRDPEREARIALEGLRELSSAFVQGAPPPESPDDLVKFLTRVRDVLDLFFRSFLPLRDGQRQFRQELGIAASQISSGAGTVEYAKSSQELSTAVLAPGQSGDALAHVESTFADLMIHQVAMMNGVMTGVKNLLGELSPDAIRHATEQLGSRGTMSFGFGGAGAKQWWQVYERRYGDLVEEEKQIFQLLFGKQFSTAYSQAASDSTAEGPRGTIGFGSPVKR